MKKNIIIISVTILIIISFSCVQNFIGQNSNNTKTSQSFTNKIYGKLQLNIIKNESRTILPDFKTITSYDITGDGPDGQSISYLNITENSKMISDLLIGNWIISISGKDLSGDVIAKGISNVEIVKDVTTDATIVVKYLQDKNGAVSIKINWIESVTIDKVSLEIDNVLISDNVFTGGNSVEYINSSIESGAYLYIFKLYFQGKLLSAITESVNIYDFHTINKTIELTESDFKYLYYITLTIDGKDYTYTTFNSLNSGYKKSAYVKNYYDDVLSQKSLKADDSPYVNLTKTDDTTYKFSVNSGLENNFSLPYNSGIYFNALCGKDSLFFSFMTLYEESSDYYGYQAYFGINSSIDFVGAMNGDVIFIDVTCDIESLKYIGGASGILTNSEIKKLTRVKMSLLPTVIYDDTQNNPSLFAGVSGINNNAVGIGIDTPIKIKFYNIWGNSSDIQMDKSVTSFYINDVLVNGIWNTEGTELNYTPVENFPANTKINIVVPETYKTITNNIIDEPTYFSFTTGATRVTSPSYINATKGQYLDKIYIDWQNTGESDIVYHLYRAELSDGNYIKVTETTSTGYDDKDVSLIKGSSYYYKVLAYNTILDETSDFCNPANGHIAVADNLPLDIYNSLTYSSSNVGGKWYEFDVTKDVSYLVYWDDSKEGSGTYNIDIRVSAYYYKEISLNYEQYFSQKDSAYNTPEVITALDNKLYLYISMNDLVSNPEFGIKVVENNPLGTPTNVTASFKTYPDKVVLNWDSVAEADKYFIYRKPDYNSGDSPTKIGESLTNSYEDTTAVNGRIHGYQIIAYNNSGRFSGYSTEVKGLRFNDTSAVKIDQTQYGLTINKSFSDNTPMIFYFDTTNDMNFTLYLKDLSNSKCYAKVYNEDFSTYIKSIWTYGSSVTESFNLPSMGRFYIIVSSNNNVGSFDITLDKVYIPTNTVINIDLTGDDISLFKLYLNNWGITTSSSLSQNAPAKWDINLTDENKDLLIYAYIDEDNDNEIDERELQSGSWFNIVRDTTNDYSIQLGKTTINVTVSGDVSKFTKPMLVQNAMQSGSSAKVVAPFQNGTIITYGNVTATHSAGGNIQAFDDLNDNDWYDSGEPFISTEMIQWNYTSEIDVSITIAPKMYIKGTFNSWTTTDSNAAVMIYVSEDLYQKTIWFDAGYHDFLIDDTLLWVGDKFGIDETTDMLNWGNDDISNINIYNPSANNVTITYNSLTNDLTIDNGVIILYEGVEPTTLFIRGDMNTPAWGSGCGEEMTKNGDIWEVTTDLTTIGGYLSSSLYRYKFAHSDTSWVFRYGENTEGEGNSDGIADGDYDINFICATDGVYKFTFNWDTKAYSVDLVP